VDLVELALDVFCIRARLGIPMASRSETCVFLNTCQEVRLARTAVRLMAAAACPFSDGRRRLAGGRVGLSGVSVNGIRPSGFVMTERTEGCVRIRYAKEFRIHIVVRFMTCDALDGP